MSIANILLLIITAYLLLLGYTLICPRTAATRLFQSVLVVSIAWAWTYYLELVQPTLEAKLVPHLVRFLFLPWLTVLWLAMLRALLGIGKGLPRWFWVACAVVATLTMMAAITAPHHRLFQFDFVIHPVGPGGQLGILKYKTGPWYAFYELMNTGLMCPLTMVLMVRAWPGASPIMRRQLLVLLAVFLAPVAVTTLYSLGHSPVPHVNLAPFAMALSIAGLSWVVLGYRALDIVPVARGVLLDNLRDLVFVTDRQGRLVDLNAAALQVVGRPLMECIGKTIGELPAPWNRVVQAAPGIQEVELAGRRWYELSQLAIRNERAELAGQLNALRDITSQHAAELALRESEAEMRLILDSIPEAVFIHDLQGRLRAVNKSMLAMYGLPNEAEALRYEIFKDYSAPDNDFEAAQNQLAHVAEGKRTVISRWKARKPLTNEVFYARVVLQFISREGELLILATVIDMTEELQQQQRELAYQKLLEEKKYLRQQELLIRDLHDGVGGIIAGISMISALGLQETEAARREVALRKIMDLAGEGNVEVRSLMNSLENREFCWPDLITELRRHGAMMQEYHGLEVVLQVEGEGDPGGPGLFAGMSLFRIFKEALNNVLKHANATRVEVRLSFTPGRMRLVIADNGAGFCGNPPTGRGLRNMLQRIREMGGEMALASAQGLHLEFTAPIPLKSPDQGIYGDAPP